MLLLARKAYSEQPPKHLYICAEVDRAHSSRFIQDLHCIQYCSLEPHSLFLRIDYIKLNPNPPAKGQNLNIEFSGYLEEEVPRYSYIDLSVKLGFFEVLRKQIDLCSEALRYGPSCPVSSGSYHYSTNLVVPSLIRK